MFRISKSLLEGNWDAYNRARIEKLILDNGVSSKTYNIHKRPYAVFDWDNTSIFLDVEEAVLVYQLENLRYAATPEQLNQAIRKGIPDSAFAMDYINAAGQPVNIDSVATDIIESYRWLYWNYEGLKGTLPLPEVKKNPNYWNFIAKMRYLYEAIGDTFDHAISYPWLTYHFVGMVEKQVRLLTRDAVEWQLTQPIGKVKWISPVVLPGKAGVVSIEWKNGLRLVPEMQVLYKALRNAGFDVWVCSASFIDVVKEISSNPEFGYSNPPDHVLAMELERDVHGIIKGEYRKGYEQTQGNGKTRNIERFLVSRYGYGPVFVAGDSEGDQNMMADFPDTELVLIINSLCNPASDIGWFSKISVDAHGTDNAKYLLQGRNDNTGAFVASQLHFKLGGAAGLALTETTPPKSILTR